MSTEATSNEPVRKDTLRAALTQVATAAAVFVLAVDFHVFMEFLFFSTKHSILSRFGSPEREAALLLAPLPVIAAGLPFFLLPALVALVRPLRGLARVLAALPAGLTLAVAAFLLVENFTHTVFGFGSTTLRGGGRTAYAVFFWSLVAAGILGVVDAVAKNSRGRRLREILVVTALALLASFVGVLLVPLLEGYRVDVPAAAAGAVRPDVFLLSADGLEAGEFGPYGGGDTPFISALAATNAGSAVFENAFTNANRTAGAVPVVLTGKHPATTHKLNSTDRLRGHDAYEHFPAVLRQLGYRSLQLGPALHVNARGWNMRRAFEVQNGQADRPGFLLRLSERLEGRLDPPIAFFEALVERVRSRLLHVFGVELMERPAFVREDADPRSRLQIALDFLAEDHPEPVFLQAHFMLTGERAAADFDGYVRQILDGRGRGALVVLWSDHGRDHAVEPRLPLIVSLPDGRVPVDLGSNAQLLDVAPTVLDALGLEVPAWMEGRSLLGPRDRLRPILAVSSDGKEDGLAWRSVKRGGPTRLTAIVCQRIYHLSLSDGRLETADVTGHTAPCAEADLPGENDVRRQLVVHLGERGYDVGGL